MQDEELVRLCKRIYRKHREAIDLIMEYGVSSQVLDACAKRLQYSEQLTDRSAAHSFNAVELKSTMANSRKRGAEAHNRPRIAAEKLRLHSGYMSTTTADLGHAFCRIDGDRDTQGAKGVDHQEGVLGQQEVREQTVPIRQRRSD